MSSSTSEKMILLPQLGAQATEAQINVLILKKPRECAKFREVCTLTPRGIGFVKNKSIDDGNWKSETKENIKNCEISESRVGGMLKYTYMYNSNRYKSLYWLKWNKLSKICVYMCVCQCFVCVCVYLCIS